MQVNFNPNYKNQNFGALHADRFAKNALLVRVANDLDWKTINDLVARQASNTDAHICLTSAPESTRLSAWISSQGKVEEYSEGLFFDFSNPVNFIKSVCDRADVLARMASDDNVNPSAILDMMG